MLLLLCVLMVCMCCDSVVVGFVRARCVPWLSCVCGVCGVCVVCCVVGCSCGVCVHYGLSLCVWLGLLCCGACVPVSSVACVYVCVSVRVLLPPCASVWVGCVGLVCLCVCACMCVYCV